MRHGGGSKLRPEATGYGLVYYVTHMLAHQGETWGGARVAISGSGNVAQYAALKVLDLGGTVISLSDSTGTLFGEFQPADVAEIAALKLDRRPLTGLSASTLARFKWVPGVRPWMQGECDVALPCATQNEVSGEEAAYLVSHSCKYVAEGSNMGCTPEAIETFEKSDSTWYAPGKAANCGGVAVSGLEMAQNSARVQWTEDKVDDELKGIMQRCFQNCYDTATKYASPKSNLPSLALGANIAGFIKVAMAMPRSRRIGSVVP